MFVLGIETSCDETAAAVVENGRTALSNVISSSLSLHRRFGGVIPEIASRAHIECIAEVVNSAVKKAGVQLKDIKLICVTSNPGLPGALRVGISFARALSLALKIPILEISHLKAHIYANFLKPDHKPRFPFIGFVVSGGHTSIFLVKDVLNWKVLGSTRDDAVGEAYDKVAKIVGLGFPGGPIIERRAAKGNPNRIKLSCANFDSSLDFSFSGIKTAVLYKFQQLERLGVSDIKTTQINDIAASFQESVVNVLVEKVISACKKHKIKRILMGGGVTVNNFLRESLAKESTRNRIKLFFPEKEFCLDNAAMVAALGYEMFKKQRSKI